MNKSRAITWQQEKRDTSISLFMAQVVKRNVVSKKQQWHQTVSFRHVHQIPLESIFTVHSPSTVEITHFLLFKFGTHDQEIIPTT